MNRVNWLRDAPLKRKLTGLIMLVSGFVLLLGCGVFAIYEQTEFRRETARDLAIIADMFDDDVAPGLVFNDSAEMAHTLETLSAHPHIFAACVYDRSGQIVASYLRPAWKNRFQFPASARTSQNLFTDRLDTFQDVTLKGEFLGVVYIGSDLLELQTRVWRYVTIVVALLAVCSLVSLVLASQLQRIISQPIEDLARIVATVATEKNYGVRALKQGDDELGRLIDGFNEMLGQIQARDAELQRAHDELEERVGARTTELQQEIAERRRSEEALRESHQRFETVTRATSDVIWDRDMRTNQVWRNKNFQTVFGYRPGEIGFDPEGLYGCVHPDDLPGVLASLHRVLESGGQLWSAEYRFRQRDGSYASVLDRGYVIRDEAGQPIRMIGAMQDISALKQAQEKAVREQERLTFIFESVSVGINLRRVRPDGGHVRLINQAHLQICGLTREQADEPGIFKRVTHPVDYEHQAPLYRQLAERKIDRFTLEKRYVQPGGRIAWVAFSIQRRDLPDGSYEELSTVVDITALKQAHEEAAREQARFKFIFDAVPVGFTWMTRGRPETRIVNPAHASLTGVSVERCRELELYWLATHPDDREPQRALHDRLQAGEIDHYEIEKRYVHADGSLRWTVLTMRLYRDSVGGETHEISTLVDITERKQSEAKLAEASGLLEAMLENSPDLIYFKDRASRFVRFSQACLIGFGLTDPEKLRGKTDFDFYAGGFAQPVYDDEQNILRTGQPIIGQLEKVNYADGRVSWVLTTKMPWRDGAGAIVGTFGISKDVTALKDTEAKLAYERDQLRALLDSSPDVIYFKDPQSRFTLVSRSKVRSIVAHVADLRARRTARGLAADVPDTELLTGLTDFDTFNNDDARLAYEDEQKIVRTGEALIGKLERQTFLDGTVRWSLTSKMPWLDREGKIIGTFGISKDISDLKETEEKLEQTHRQLLQTSRQAGMAEIATGVLHNVGNVLNSVNVSATLVADHVRHTKAVNVAKVATLFEQHRTDLAEFLTQDPRGQMIPGYLGTLAESLAVEHTAMLEELEHLRKNIEHIKDIVSMQQAYATTSGVYETVSVPDLIEDALRINAGSLARHAVDTVRDYQARPVITTDKHKVMQVLINLVGNAKYACDESGRTDKQITVRTTSDGLGVRIAVIDNGIGIGAENLARIFNHGFTTKKTGHGFGLHSSALAAKELGGSLGVQSDGPGRGSVFTLHLPFKSPAAA